MPKITYIYEGEEPNTARIIVDGEPIDSTNFVGTVDSNIHAIQWDGTSGEIEYKDGSPNTTISDISSYGFETAHATAKKAIEDAEIKAEVNERRIVLKNKPVKYFFDKKSSSISLKKAK